MKYIALFGTVMLFGSSLCGQADLTARKEKSMLITGTFQIRTAKTTEVHSFGIKGDAVRTGNALLSCRGSCEVTLGSVLLKADEVDFHSDTGEGEVRGNVTMKALPVYGAVTSRQ